MSTTRQRGGKRPHLVTVEAPSEVVDSRGGVTHTHASAGTRWASIEQLSGSELQHAAQSNSLATHKMRLYAFSGLTTDHRIAFDSRVFNIESFNDVNERGKMMELKCVEDVAES